ncbi:lytic transglycosylase domain-containing protein [Pseudomonas aeruginosa]
MADKPIIRIPVDTEEWDRFIDSWQLYNSQLEKNSEAWASSNKGIRQQKTAFDDVDKSFSDLVSKATDNKFSGPGGAFVKVQKNSKETEKSWRNIAKDLEKSAKSMGGLARSSLGLGGLGFIGAAAGAAGGVFAGVKNADNDLASQNSLNRRLALEPGEAKAFETTFEKAGGDVALLSKIAEAKADPTQWRYLQAAGVSQKEIQTLGTEELSESFLKHVGQKVRELGPQQFGMWANAQGITKFSDVNSLRLAGSYKDSDYAGMHDQYVKLRPQLAAQQKQLDEATAARAKIEADLAKDALALDLVFLKFNPLITGAADAFADWITKLSKSGELDTDIKNIMTAFEALGTAADKLEKALDWLANQEKPLPSQQTQLGKGLIDAFNDLKAGNPAKAWADLNRPIDGAEQSGDNKAGSVNSSTPDFQGRVLDAIKQNESSGKPGAVNPASGAAGLYGLMPDNAKGIDVDDPVAARKAAGKVLNEQLKAFNGDYGRALSAYDGDTHVREDDKKYGGKYWLGMKSETINYLERIEKQGIDLGLPPEEQAWLDAHTTDKKTTAAATHDKALAKVAKADSMSDKSDQQAVSESFTDRMVRAANKLRDAVGNGMGSFVHDSGVTARRIDRQGNAPGAPYSVDVRVFTPAGNSTVITTGGLAG